MYSKIHSIIGSFPSQNLEVEESVEVASASQLFEQEQECGNSSSAASSMLRSPSPSIYSPSPTPSGSQRSSTSSKRSGKQKKRCFQEMLLEEFHRSNESAERISEESINLQKKANSLLERSLLFQEELLKKMV